MNKFTQMFRTADGKSYAFTFVLVCSLFLLWGFCSGLLDNLNKHFQNSLKISKFQSGFVQNAFYMGYFLMALPAGMLARKFGYKGGIIIGLVLTAAGAFWFIPATMISIYGPLPVGISVMAIGAIALGFCLFVMGGGKMLSARSGSQFLAIVSGLAIISGGFISIGGGFGLAGLGNLGNSQMVVYCSFLLGLFIIATGLACLETIANPYTTVLGPPESGATRINLAQTCNGVGWVTGMLLGTMIILSASQEVNASNERLYVPYLGIGIVVTILIVVFIFAKVPDLHATEEFKAEAEGKATKPIVKRAHFTMGVVSQFLYVAAQTGIFSFFINYAVVNVEGLTDQVAGKWQSAAFFLFMLGRLTGSAVVGFTQPHKALSAYAIINTIMMVVAMAAGGWVGVISLMASFFFMSIMFPTIFALSIRGLGEHTKLGASVLVMSIVGGAIMTPLMGWIADKGGMKIGFVIPMLCFAFIALYGAIWRKLEDKDAAADTGGGKVFAGH